MELQRNERAPASPILAEIDKAIRTDDENRKSRLVDSKQKDDEERMSVLTRVMRILGALVLVSSTAIFLLQGWQDAGYIMRYYSFLAFTLVLTISGFICGLRVKEDKGARTFLAIAVGVVPAHFAQLGAFVYSGFGNAINPSRYPDFALWIAPDPYTALHTIGVAMVVLLPIIYLGFTALVRKSAKKLTMLFAGLCAVLLIPTRDPLVIGVMGLAASVGLSLVDAKYLSHSSHGRTKEGIIARTMMWTPIALLFGRNLTLYGSDLSLFGFALLGVAAFMFFLLGNCIEGEDGALHQILAQVPAGFGWTLIALQISNDYRLADEVVIPLVVLPLAGLLLVMAEYAKSHKKFFRGTATTIATAGMAINLFIAPNLYTGFIALLIGMASVIYGYAVQKRYHCLVGGFTVFCSLGYYVGEAIEHLSISPWMSLAILGVLTIFLASFLERNYKHLRQRLVQMKENVTNWS